MMALGPAFAGMRIAIRSRGRPAGAERLTIPWHPSGL